MAGNHNRLLMCAKAVQFEITSPDGDSYQAIQNSENQFKYGYQVRNVNDQFQHVYKSPDNVTYGCYGYTHPTGGSIMHSIFFVADQFGYRTVRKGQPIIIYPAPGTSPVLKQWQELPIPAACLRSDADFSQNVAESSANNPVVVSFDGNQSSLESDSSVVNSIVVPYDHTEDKAHPVVSEINSRAQSDSSSGCWRPFPGGISNKPLDKWLFAVVYATSATDDAFNIELKQKDAEVYHEQSFGKNEFNYGYQVERTNSQFQHKVKGPDDVTYGCYGYIDPVGEKHLVYYIADRLGYRLLAPDQPTKVFTDRVANSVNRLDADLQGRKLDEKVVAWNDLYLPSTCRRLNEIVSITPPPTTVRPVQPPANNLQDGSLIRGSHGQGITRRPEDESAAGSASKDEDKMNTGSGSTSGIGNPPIDVSSKSNESSPSGSDSTHSAPNNGANDLSNGDQTRVEESNHHGDVDRVRSTTPQSIPLTPTTPRPHVESHTIEQEPSPAIRQTASPPRTTYLPVTTTSSPPIIRVPDQPHSQSNCGHDPFAPRPKYPNSVAQFNGFVFPINRNCDDSGRNTADLLAQMQSLNEMVLKVSNTLHVLVETDRNRTSTGETCERVLELLNIQQKVPLLVYVPIMVPYLDVGSKPPVNPASYAFAKTCSDCK
uniref:Uncharacterized protein n=1 Tax=Anopheles minimus TaxID=112268 RepID=A0A182WFA1_9DIPT